jgi:hypothetical protein
MAEENEPNEELNNKILQEMVKENLAMTKEIYEMTRSIKRYINFQKIMSFVYFLLIVGPIILGLIYLPPLLGNIMGQYEQVLGAPEGSLKNMFKSGTGQDLNQIKNQLDELLKNQNK